MLLMTFAKLARGEAPKARPGVHKRFVDALEGKTATPALTPGEFAILANGTKRPRGAATARKVKAFLEHGGPLPRGLSGKRRALTESQQRASVGPGLELGRGQHELLEDVSQAGQALTVEGNVIKNVRILGTDSKNGRRYLMEAIREALPLYEGLRVNIDHPAKPTDPRSFRDRFGKLENVRAVEGDGMRGDLRFNPEHKDAKAFAWWAVNEPGLVGLSHNAVGAGRNEGGTFVVEKIVKVRSLDVVSDPATTAGLLA